MGFSQNKQNIKEGIERSEKYITKLKKELNRIEENE